MNPVLLWFGIAALIIGALASIAIWSPRDRRIKLGALGCATLMLPISYISLNDLLGRPKGIDMDTASAFAEQARVISSVVEEDVAIYLWLQLDGIDDPRAFQLPWDKQLAIDLHKAQQQAEAEGTKVKMRKLDEESLDEQEPVFYAAAQPAPPPKQAADDNPILFQASRPD
jgi:hypothetical protein